MYNIFLQRHHTAGAKSPDIRQFITITLPEHLQPKDCVDDVSQAEGREESVEATTPKLKDVKDFLPEEVQSLPHEARDVLKRLLEFDGQKRIHSVRALQRIAMYKDFKIESKYILNIRPLDIITADNITLYSDDEHQSFGNSFDADKAFQNF